MIRSATEKPGVITGKRHITITWFLCIIFLRALFKLETTVVKIFFFFTFPHIKYIYSCKIRDTHHVLHFYKFKWSMLKTEHAHLQLWGKKHFAAIETRLKKLRRHDLKRIWFNPEQLSGRATNRCWLLLKCYLSPSLPRAFRCATCSPPKLFPTPTVHEQQLFTSNPRIYAQCQEKKKKI